MQISPPTYSAALHDITTRLLQHAVTDDKGMYWKNEAAEAVVPEYRTRINENIFNGSAGIFLYFHSLYLYSRTPSHLSICRQILNRLLADDVCGQPAYYTFYTGCTGIIYCCVKMYEISGDRQYLIRGAELAAAFEPGIRERVSIADLLSGDAGNLIPLIFLHHYHPAPFLSTLIADLLQRLIDTAIPAEQGWRWGDGHLSADCLTGMSHGGAGIAHVLLEAGRYFQSADLIQLATMALDYEMNYYDPQRQNWADLRVIRTQMDYPACWYWDKSYFMECASDINAWAHGAIGAAFPRLDAYKATGRDVYRQQAVSALQRCRRDWQQRAWKDFCLCSGYGGMAMLFLHAASVLQEPAYRETAVEILSTAVTEPFATDPGLFTGLAGIGYLLLQVLHPASENMLHPALPAGKAGSIPVVVTAIQEQLCARFFPQTLQLLRGRQTVMEIPLQITDTTDPRLQDAWQYENAVLQRWYAFRGALCHHTRITFLQSRLPALVALSDEDFLSQTFERCPFVSCCTTDWSWQHQQPAAGRQYLLLYSDDSSVQTMPVQPLTWLILEKMERPVVLSDIISELAAAHGLDITALKHRVLPQVKELLKSYFITGRIQ